MFHHCHDTAVEQFDIPLLTTFLLRPPVLEGQLLTDYDVISQDVT